MDHEGEEGDQARLRDRGAQGVAGEHAAEAEERRREGGVGDHADGDAEGLGVGQVAEVDDEAQGEADHQGVAEHRAGDGAGGPGQGGAVGAGQFHRRDPDEVAEGGVDRDDPEVGGHRVRSIGALHDREAEQDGVGEEGGEGDGDGFAGAAVEEVPYAEIAQGEGDEGSGVEGDEQRGAEDRGEVEVDDGAKEQAGDGEVLGVVHQPVGRREREDPGAGRRVARAHHQEDRQDDAEDGGDHISKSSTMPSWAGVTWAGVSAARVA